MHKRIVEAIMQALSQHDRELLRFFIMPQKTDGFWQLCVVPQEGFEHLISNIEHIGVHIGRFYGEGLCVERHSDHIIFS